MPNTSAHTSKDNIFHPLHSVGTDGFVLPPRFNNPFHYQPHPVCIEAAEALKRHIEEDTELAREAAKGKMFGVLVVKDSNGDVGFLAAFSGILCGSNTLPHFVPPVYDLQDKNGYFPHEEQNISDINRLIVEKESSEHLSHLKAEYEHAHKEEVRLLKEAREQLRLSKEERNKKRASGNLSPQEDAQLIRESQHQKAEYKRLERTLKETTHTAKEQLDSITDEINRLKQERKSRSAALQQWLFEQFVMLNALGERKNLIEIFSEESTPVPPAGSGECCAPKLLQYAFSHSLHPICMAEFWLGASPKDEIRRHGEFYPSCVSKCKPILRHMLRGLDVEENQQMLRMEATAAKMRIIYEDEHIIAIDKPSGMLSVPAKDDAPSVYSKIKEQRPELDGSTLMVHRLDMDTSGVLLLSKDKHTHKALQEQFLRHEVKKTYIALLEGAVESDSGTITLPLSPSHNDRPRQMVDHVKGKQAVTHYEVIDRTESSTRIIFRPQTGRTHQLRMHSAHPEGLAHPIIGDPLYGHHSSRMFLHAASIEFTHPTTGKRMTIESPCEF